MKMLSEGNQISEVCDLLTVLTTLYKKIILFLHQMIFMKNMVC